MRIFSSDSDILFQKKKTRPLANKRATVVTPTSPPHSTLAGDQSGSRENEQKLYGGLKPFTAGRGETTPKGFQGSHEGPDQPAGSGLVLRPSKPLSPLSSRLARPLRRPLRRGGPASPRRRLQPGQSGPARRTCSPAGGRRESGRAEGGKAARGWGRGRSRGPPQHPRLRLTSGRAPPAPAVGGAYTFKCAAPPPRVVQPHGGGGGNEVTARGPALTGAFKSPPHVTALPASSPPPPRGVALFALPAPVGEGAGRARGRDPEGSALPPPRMRAERDGLFTHPKWRPRWMWIPLAAPTAAPARSASK